MQQSVGLLYHTKTEIGFFKIIKSPIPRDSILKEGERLDDRFKQLKNKSVCFSNFYDIDQIVFDPQTVGQFITLSKNKNAIMVLQASGGGKDIQCKIKGIIRFANSKKAKDYKIKKLELQMETSMLFISFEDTTQFAMIPYDNSNFADNLLNLNPDDIVDKYLYESRVEEDGQLKDFDLYQIDRYLLLRELSTNANLPNQFATQTTILELALDQEI